MSLSCKTSFKCRYCCYEAKDVLELFSHRDKCCGKNNLSSVADKPKDPVMEPLCNAPYNSKVTTE